MSMQARDPQIDLLTVVALAVVLMVIGAFTHEVIGHGGAALLAGAGDLSVSSSQASYDVTSVTATANRWIAAAGPLANFVLGLASLFVLRRITFKSGRDQYFVWLLGHGNLFAAAGYGLAFAFLPFGDWDQVVAGLAAEGVWRSLISILSIVVSFMTLAHATRTLVPFAGQDPGKRKRRVALLTVVPYVVEGVLSMAIAAFGTHDLFLVFLSAGAASFGGDVFLLWVNFVLPRLKNVTALETPLGVKRSYLWLGLAVVAFLFDMFVLGPGARV